MSVVSGATVHERNGWLLDSLMQRPVEQILTFHLIRDTYHNVIRSFADKRTAAIWADRMPKGFPSDLARAARRKLRMVMAATRIEDLRNPPGNRLETLAGDRAGQHSIRINNQWRLCFAWRDGDAYDVEIVDYH